MKPEQRRHLEKLADDLVTQSRFNHIGDEALGDTVEFEPIPLFPDLPMASIHYFPDVDSRDIAD